MNIVQVNFAYDDRLHDPTELLDRYETLTGWSEAVAAAGAVSFATVQRFQREARVTRNGIDYLFCRGIDQMVRAVSSARPDVAHVNGLEFPVETWHLRRRLPVSTVIVVQNHSDGGPVGRAPLLRLAGRVTRHVVDAFLFAADEHADAWRRAGLIAMDQPAYQVMEGSTTLRGMSQVAARAASAVRGSPACLWVGRLNRNKDPLTVLDGFERSVAELPDAELTMVYSADDLLREVRARIDASPALRSRVRLAGRVPHDRMASFYSAADLFVLGSHHEGSGYALMEALACGTAPVVTNIPTFRLLTQGGALGALWTPADPNACARAMVDVASGDMGALRTRIAEHFEREFGWPAVGRRAVSIYRDVRTRDSRRSARA